MLRYATLLKVTLFHGGFYCFSNCANSTKLRKTSQIQSCDTYINTEAGQLMKLVAKLQLIALRNILHLRAKSSKFTAIKYYKQGMGVTQKQWFQ